MSNLLAVDTKQEKIKDFDPNGATLNNGKLFGLPFNFEESELIILPVPWEVTASYNGGASMGPKAILDASLQVDLYDTDLENAWQYGIYMLEISKDWLTKNNRLRMRANEIIRFMEKGGEFPPNGQMDWTMEDINKGCLELEKWVFEQTNQLLNHGKKVAVIGGDHSVALGYMKSLSVKYESYGILQIDAHADLRKNFEGFEYSHASIMYNALKIPNISKLVQIGGRDFCEEEIQRIEGSNGKITCFTDSALKERLYEGEQWKNLCNEIIEQLPDKVYISFDIDGLDPKLCPNSGAIVPGGFELEPLFYLFRSIVKTGREIIGYDLSEVAPGGNDWDGNVGARVLYKLSNLMIKSQNKKAAQ